MSDLASQGALTNTNLLISVKPKIRHFFFISLKYNIINVNTNNRHHLEDNLEDGFDENSKETFSV